VTKPSRLSIVRVSSSSDRSRVPCTWRLLGTTQEAARGHPTAPVRPGSSRSSRPIFWVATSPPSESTRAANGRADAPTSATPVPALTVACLEAAAAEVCEMNSERDSERRAVRSATLLRCRLVRLGARALSLDAGPGGARASNHS